ncbi:Hint domain-containing protein [Jannaschia rubra]|uniref:Hint domain-containing protein n=1 Tax=Jannaschia rubra TaxID=282197 RepID=UPI00249267B0|nr:Hint domain-containing protein [Jannaschia rubra]
MSAFITLTDTSVTDAGFWSGLDLDGRSTIDATGLDDRFAIRLDGGSITFTDTDTGDETTWSDDDLGDGSFSDVIQVKANDAGSDVSGADRLGWKGYVGGDGDDTFRDDGERGGTMRGGDGNDTLVGGTGNNNLYGGQGDDELSAGEGGNNNLWGGEGDDTLIGGPGKDNLRGDRGDDQIFGGSGTGNLFGGEGDDTVTAGEFEGNLFGGRGDDVIVAGTKTQFATGGSGDDRLIVPEGATFEPYDDGSDSGVVTLPDGTSFVYTDFESVDVACFTAETPLSTPGGEVPVGDLRVGDLVETLDHGPQPIRWIGRRTVPGVGAHAPVHFLPGAIGNTHEIRLSPQHRVMMAGWKCELLFDATEMLCAAKHLCDGDRIYLAPCTEVTYVHVMFDRHEVVLSGGALLESFFAGDRILEADREIYDELVSLFPQIAQGTHPAQTPARPIVRAFEARLM